MCQSLFLRARPKGGFTNNWCTLLAVVAWGGWIISWPTLIHATDEKIKRVSHLHCMCARDSIEMATKNSFRLSARMSNRVVKCASYCREIFCASSLPFLSTAICILSMFYWTGMSNLRQSRLYRWQWITCTIISYMWCFLQLSNCWVLN